MSSVTLELPAESLVNAALPASVAAGNVETSQRITDVLMRAFGVALPEHMPALSQGTMNNTTVGGIDPRNGKAFAYYETVGGGMGAGPTGRMAARMSSTGSLAISCAVSARAKRLGVTMLTRTSVVCADKIVATPS